MPDYTEGMTLGEELEMLYGRIAALDAELAAERARLAEVTANAERYLYIRTESLIHWETGKKRNRISWPTLYAADPSYEGTYRDRFDAAIDAAMKGAQ